MKRKADLRKQKSNYGQLNTQSQVIELSIRSSTVAIGRVEWYERETDRRGIELPPLYRCQSRKLCCVAHEVVLAFRPREGLRLLPPLLILEEWRGGDGVMSCDGGKRGGEDQEGRIRERRL